MYTGMKTNLRAPSKKLSQHRRNLSHLPPGPELNAIHTCRPPPPPLTRAASSPPLPRYDWKIGFIQVP